MDQRFHPTRDRRVRQGPGQISRSRLANRPDPFRMHCRALVFLHSFAVHLTAAWRQRFHQGSFHRARRFFTRANACLSATGESETQGRSKHRTVFHPRRLRRSDFVVAGSDFLFSQTQKSTPANRAVHPAIAEISALFRVSLPFCNRTRCCKSMSARPVRRRGNTPIR